MAPAAALPTSQPAFPPGTDIYSVSQEWLGSFAHALHSQDTLAILQTFHSDGWWRDIFALTWDLRTFHGHDNIRTFFQERLIGQDDEIGFAVNADRPAFETELLQMYDDLQFVRVQFNFETKVANGRAFAFLTPAESAIRSKAFILSTQLVSLKDYPEHIGPLRSFAPNHGKWEEARRREQAFKDSQVQPEVIVVGSGNAALGVAARLGTLGVRTLVVEKNQRVGDNWRNRYDALCLHDTVWSNHLPYLDFPPTWPAFTPARKLANWLEHYAEVMELNVWTSTLVTNASRDDKSGKWSVTMRNLKSGEEKMLVTDHIVFALGFVGEPKIPDILGRELYTGQTLHSSQHKSAMDHLGKKVVVVGACTSAHDICAEYAEYGVDVTMIQRSSTFVMSDKEGMPRLLKPFYWEGGPPIDVADRLANCFPHKLGKILSLRTAQATAEADREMLDGLHTRGYKTNDGEGGGIMWLFWTRAGGYYIDMGACQKIIDGKIKIKNGTKVERFTPTGLVFEDGEEVQADVVLFATGYGDMRDLIRPIVGDAVADKIPRIWNFNEEGEISGAWRELGTEGIWYTIGNFAWARFFSRHIALQIKAKQAGIFGTRYSAPVVM
ncbi:hypothetical protein BXZ70DRAFT_466132 [Cristinia sonorae]|uniref:FAD/NAD(P)-binding domain-containing protein n=1 Tax=Cristinia sonorae TaxID=1940300 RepID=A0A8K0XM54_9AGAR|nr:hypothetical protein BXZ70DRAFT_466132 [Cristinia sonorae]